MIDYGKDTTKTGTTSTTITKRGTLFNKKRSARNKKMAEHRKTWAKTDPQKSGRRQKILTAMKRKRMAARRK